MLKLLTDLPDKFYVAVSGGVDSMVAFDFLSHNKGFVGIVHCNHGTEFGKQAEQFLFETIDQKVIDKSFFIKLEDEKPKDQSKEEFWSNWRAKVFNSVPHKVITAHHLNDAVEWFLLSSFHGEGKLIPVTSGHRKNVIRPFLTTPKAEFENWARWNDVKFLNDPSNLDVSFNRNMIRHKILPLIKEINPGIEKTIRKKYLHEETQFSRVL